MTRKTPLGNSRIRKVIKTLKTEDEKHNSVKKVLIRNDKNVPVLKILKT